MSEVDRLSNSGLYPALPIADQRSSRERPPFTPPRRRAPGGAAPGTAATAADAAAEPAVSDTGTYRIPKSLIDDFA